MGISELALPTASEWQEFEARMVKKPGESPGLAVGTNGNALLILDCFEEGLASSWNAMNSPCLKLQVGDKIIRCNGASDPDYAMLSCISQSGRCAIRLKVLRGPFSPVAPSSPPLHAVSPFSIFDDTQEVQERERIRAVVLKAKRDDAQAEYDRRQREKTKVSISEDREELQRLIAERLFKNPGT